MQDDFSDSGSGGSDEGRREKHAAEVSECVGEAIQGKPRILEDNVRPLLHCTNVIVVHGAALLVQEQCCKFVALVFTGEDREEDNPIGVLRGSL